MKYFILYPLPKWAIFVLLRNIKYIVRWKEVAQMYILIIPVKILESLLIDH